MERMKKIHPLVVILVVVLAALAIINAVRTNNKNRSDGDGVLSVHFVDVGQGDGVVIKCDDTVLVIDGGEEDAAGAMVRYLKSLGVKTVDCYIATHPHSDHIGAAPAIFKAFKIKDVMTTAFSDLNTPTTSIYSSFLTAVENEKCTVTSVSAGQTCTFGELKLDILAPVHESADYNDMSIVFRLNYKNTSFLFTGDATAASEEAMLAAGYDLSADVLKVGHHGSDSSTSTAFLSAVHPSIAVISCGKDNPHGHPHAAVMRRLADDNIQVRRTDTEGTVIVCSNGDDVYVRE